MMDEERKLAPKTGLWSGVRLIAYMTLVVFGGLWLLGGAPLSKLPKGAIIAFLFFATFVYLPLFVWACERLGLARDGNLGPHAVVVMIATFFFWGTVLASLYDQVVEEVGL
jgi:hypothetical protein